MLTIINMIQKFSVIIASCDDPGLDNLINSFLGMDVMEGFSLNKIFVVRCGSKEQELPRARKIIFIEEKSRKGKSAAINKALRMIKDDVILLVSGDLSLKRNSVENLLKPLKNPNVGMSCSRPLTTNNSGFIGFLNSLVWDMHHIISTASPKGGEMVAFRNLSMEIPEDIAADEAYIESVVTGKGYSVAYASSSVVLSPGPVRLRDFIIQRRRIFSGHLQVKYRKGYTVSTMSSWRLMRAVLEYPGYKKSLGLKQMLWLISAVFIELYSRVCGFVDYKAGKVLFAWPLYEKK